MWNRPLSRRRCSTPGPHAPCAYLRFSAPYVDAATEAARRGWPVETLEAGHFHMLVDPAPVGDALERLVAATLRP